ncbi:hypothetical protein SAMN05216378_1649 [Paenibacillus catalpae]|uniref:Uncharacterized protein n=1 Tax=Paenibacillus catalpae TaxID=1045775 RepID=A0A1I1VR19_9BACL|nr:hypothetical protein SAMN05216378_1649 [Paenibacillus catalpae]
MTVVCKTAVNNCGLRRNMTVVYKTAVNRREVIRVLAAANWLRLNHSGVNMNRISQENGHSRLLGIIISGEPLIIHIHLG